MAGEDYRMAKSRAVYLVPRQRDVERLTVFARGAGPLAGNKEANGMDAPAF
jgi:hypothetical protein